MPTGRAPACCRRPATSSRRASSCSPAPPAAGRACSRCIAGSCSSARTPSDWTRYDVVGWGNPVRTNGWPADGRWFGNMPVAIADVSGAEAERLIPKIEAAMQRLSLQPGRRLPHLAGAEQQQLHRRRAARGAGTGRGAAAERRRPRFPRRLLCRPHRQRHRRRAQSVRLCRRQARLGRGRRGQSARAGGRARSAPSRR